MRQAFVTGANRGLGLAFVRWLMHAGDAVTAGCRSPEAADELNALAASAPGQVRVLACDVTDHDSLAACAQQLAADAGGLDLVINNAGVWDPSAADELGASGPLASLGYEALTRVLGVNAAGPVAVTRAFAGLLAARDRSVVVNITSGLGSLARAAGGSAYGYAMSKAALNMATRLLARELADQGTTVVSLDPGWVRTDLGGPAAHLSPDESVDALVAVIDQLGPEHSGGAYNRRFEPVAW
jgi:NAD(P)-dependent dehydrogenase (short-subunit alcohol dehydrogenase family)